MTAGPGDQGAADVAAGGYLRASHADREQVIAVLKTAFMQGMLTKEELDAQARRSPSRTHGELAALTADLPAGLAAATPPGKTVAAQAEPPVNKALLWGSWVVVLLARALPVARLQLVPGAGHHLPRRAPDAVADAIAAFLAAVEDPASPG